MIKKGQEIKIVRDGWQILLGVGRGVDVSCQS